MPLAAITGATGFIGSVITRQLLAHGWRVRALVRSAAGGQALEAIGADIQAGSLTDVESLRELTRQADAVVHCAGAVRGVDYSDFKTVNVRGTANLLGALPDREMPLVVLSSLAAREPQLSHYARSKREMEALLGSSQTATQWLALRPPPVYGPGDRELMPLFQSLARGLAPLPAPPGARVSLLYVDDLARAVLAWLQQSKRESGVYALHDGQPHGYSWDEIVATAQALTGRRIRKLHLPAAPLQVWTRANAGLARVLRYAPMLTPGKLRELRHDDWVCDNAALQQHLNWQPQTTLTAGLKLTCGWGLGA